MNRSRATILAIACAAAVLALAVFRVRVFVAGGKLVLVLGLIALAAWALWPRNRGP